MPPHTQIPLPRLRDALAGRYRIARRIATGGQATVYRATSLLQDGEPAAALKVYHAESQRVDERTKREMRALGSLESPTVVRLMDAGSLKIGTEKFQYVATQFVDGEALDKVFQRGPLSIEHAAQIGHDVALGIDALWLERLVHRDIKPGNVMFTPAHRAVIIDLGIARHMRLASITTEGVAWGTEGYMSPEQMVAQRALTCKSDMFALGVLLQEAVLGSHPTGGRQHLLARGGLPTASLRRDIPGSFCGLVDRMVTWRPVLRPAPVEVATVLTAFLAGGE